MDVSEACRAGRCTRTLASAGLLSPFGPSLRSVSGSYGNGLLGRRKCVILGSICGLIGPMSPPTLVWGKVLRFARVWLAGMLIPLGLGAFVQLPELFAILWMVSWASLGYVFAATLLARAKEMIEQWCVCCGCVGTAKCRDRPSAEVPTVSWRVCLLGAAGLNMDSCFNEACRAAERFRYEPSPRTIRRLIRSWQSRRNASMGESIT
jgi:hypothetical protein